MEYHAEYCAVRFPRSKICWKEGNFNPFTIETGTLHQALWSAKNYCWLVVLSKTVFKHSEVYLLNGLNNTISQTSWERRVQKLESCYKLAPNELFLSRDYLTFWLTVLRIYWVRTYLQRWIKCHTFFPKLSLDMNEVWPLLIVWRHLKWTARSRKVRRHSITHISKPYSW